MRTGILWFLLVLAAVTSGRWWIAALMSIVAFGAAAQLVMAWDRHLLDVGDRQDDATVGTSETPPRLTSLARGAVAGAGAVAVTVAAGWGTGLAGVLLAAFATVGALALLGGAELRRVAGPVVVGLLAAAIASASVVLAVRHDLWAGLFLVLALSLYDAGAFVFGAEATGRWEGPVGGLIGVAAVTFTMSVVQVLPMDTAAVWIAGGAVAIGCVAGQLAVSALLPTPNARAGALRRLDTALVAGPLFLACLWTLSA